MTVCSPEDDRRIAFLHALDLLDTESEREFDMLVALAAAMLKCPVALLSLVDRDRQWIKAKHGTDIVETRRDIAFCDHTIRTDDVMIIRDATADGRFCDNPLVTGDPEIRFYAGAPLHAADADGTVHRIGSLCVIDSQVRAPSEQEIEALTHLAGLTEALIAAREGTRKAVALAKASREQEQRLSRQEVTFHQAERMAMIGSWRLTLDDQAISWSEGVYRIHEIPVGMPVDLSKGLDFYPPDMRGHISAALTRTLETGEPFRIESDFTTALGNQRRVRSCGELEMEDGRPIAIIGVFQDISERHRMETSLRVSATVDETTGIANRAAFNAMLAERLALADAGQPIALAMIDLDHFKPINDTHGHLAGDEVLRATAQRLCSSFLKDSFAARLGGDEFALIITDPALIANLPGVVEALLATLKLPVQFANVSIAPSATIGTAISTGGITPHAQMHAADIALYRAKRARRGSHCLAA